MTRRRFYAPSAAFDFNNRIVTLGTDEARHARDVLRLHAGDEVYVFDGQGNEFQGKIQSFTGAEAVIDINSEVESAQPESVIDLTIGISLLKGEKFDLVIQKTTELGIDRIVPLKTERADVRLKSDEDARRRLTRWQRISLEAAKQSGRARLPQIEAPRALDVFLKSADFAPATKLFFSERDGVSLTDSEADRGGSRSQIVAVVGPEGGWADEELAQARAAQWQIVTLGGRTLRAETAAIAIVALLQHRFGDLI